MIFHDENYPTIFSFFAVTGIARSVSPGHHVRYVMYSPMAPNTPPSAGGKVVDSSQYANQLPQVRKIHIFSPRIENYLHSIQLIRELVIFSQEERRVPPVAPVRSATINNSPHPKLSASPLVKNHSGEMSVGTVARKPIPLGRGVPPPVPPNKPIIPPKKDGILNRKLEVVCSDNNTATGDGKNSQPRGLPLLPTNTVKVKMPTSERQNEDEVNRELTKLQL